MNEVDEKIVQLLEDLRQDYYSGKYVKSLGIHCSIQRVNHLFFGAGIDLKQLVIVTQHGISASDIDRLATLTSGIVSKAYFPVAMLKYNRRNFSYPEEYDELYTRTEIMLKPVDQRHIIQVSLEHIIVFDGVGDDRSVVSHIFTPSVPISDTYAITSAM
jgi:hypothetical protein